MKRILAALLCIGVVFFAQSCGDDDAGGPTVDTNTYEGVININPNNFPAGGGLDLSVGDTGRVAQLDEVAALEWDIQVIAYRTAMGGRPGVLLFGDVNTATATKALNVSEYASIALGATGFNSFTEVTQGMQQALVADGVFNFDPQTDVDGQGRADATILATAYENLVIGNRIVNLDEANQPVFLVQSREGAFYKFQMVSREQGGATTLRWARFADSAID